MEKMTPCTHQTNSLVVFTRHGIVRRTVHPRVESDSCVKNARFVRGLQEDLNRDKEGYTTLR